MDCRIADGHVHLEDVVIGEFDSPRIMLDSLADKGVTDVSLLAYMPFSDIVTNLRVLYWKKNYRRMNVRAFGCFHEADIYREIPLPVWNHLIRGLALSDDTVRKICCGNYIRFVGDTPGPVNDAFMLETAERMLSDIQADPEMAPSAAWLREMILNRKT